MKHLALFLLVMLAACGFKAQVSPAESATCVRGGCSNELCVDANAEPMASTCQYSPVYDCYKTAVCEQQKDGTCGWRQTVDLRNCINTTNTGIVPPHMIPPAPYGAIQRNIK